MGVRNRARLIIYRVNKKGLEIFLLKPTEGQGENWQIPQGSLTNKTKLDATDNDRMIELEPFRQENGEMISAWAVEGDWHEIPSIRAVIKQDVRIVKDHIKQHIPDLEQGTYVAVKEVFKKVMPDQYKCVKELKDILTDRNQAMYI